ncbi:MAG: translocation/assembly module TamB [Bacteroidales bacterium]|nr:translocation/assembly module TamB [Bacteroidales bacterium]
MATTKQILKKVFKRVVLTLLGLVVLLGILFSSPFVQNKLIDWWLAQQSRALGITARVQSVDVNLFSRNVKIVGFEVYDHHQNLLIDIGSLQTTIRSFSSSHLTLGTTHVVDIVFRLHRYEEDSVSNFKRIIDLLTNPDRDPNAPNFAFKSSSVFLKNGDLSYINETRSLGDTFQFMDFNHVLLSDVNLSAKNVDIVGSQVMANIENLSFDEQKGFNVSKFATRLNLSPTGIIARETRIASSSGDVDFDLRFTTNSWLDYKEFVSNVRIYTKFRTSNLNLSELAYFAPKLENMHNQFQFSGSIWGYVNHFQTKDFKFSYGRNTRFDGDIYISGLPKLDQTFFDFSIAHLITSPQDIESFSLPNAERIAFPNELNKLGSTSLSGELYGYPSDLTASVSVMTSVGHVQTDFKFLHDKAAETFDFSGHINDSRLDFGRVLNEKTIGNNLSLRGSFGGNFSTENGMDLSVNMVFENVEYQKRQIDTISIKGDWKDQLISALISIDDNEGTAEFSGELSLDPKNLYLDVAGFFKDVDLHSLGLLNDTNQPVLSTDFSAKIYSFNIDSLVGTANVSNLQFAFKDTMFHLKNFLISQEVLPQGTSTKVDCDFFKADISGTYKFSTLDAIWFDIQSSYLSAVGQSIKEIESLAIHPQEEKSVKKIKLSSEPQTLSLRLNMFKTEGLLSYLVPNVYLPNGANLKLDYNEKGREHLSVTLFAKNAFAFGVSASHFDLLGRSKDSVLGLDMDIKNLHFKNTRYFETLSLSSELQNNAILWQLDWTGVSDQNAPLNGNFDGSIDVLSKDKISLNIKNSELLFIDQLWQFAPNSIITIDPDGVYFENFRFFKQSDPDEYLSLSGDLSRSPDSRLNLAFNRYQLLTWTPFIKQIGLDFEGDISGEINIFDFYNNLHFNSDLRINEFAINQFNYGTAFLQTTTNGRRTESLINFEIQDSIESKTYLSATGYFTPSRTKQNFDIRVSIFEMDLSLLRNYVNSFSSSLTGKFGGELTLDGPMRRPNFYGDVITRDAVLKIDFLNTYYALTCEKIAFSLDRILFVGADLEDMQHKTRSTLSGGLYHNRFKDFRLDLGLDMTNFLALNTSQLHNEVFFGKAFVTGRTNLTGKAQDILIDVQARTERGTEIQVNHSSNVNISETNQFIHFVTPTINIDTIIVQTPTIEANPANIIVRLNIEVTPDATFLFDMDIPPTAGLIHVSGSGNLRLNFESRSRLFTMFGDYVLQDGFYDFSFEDRAFGRLITRRFQIERGGTIQWTGDPGNMILNISAIYSTRASLFPVLSTSFVALDHNYAELRRKANVQSVISLDGRMSQPNVRFDFRLPNTDDNIRTQFFNIVNNDENEMTKQTFYLLLFGGFTAPGNNAILGPAADVNAEAMAWDMLSNQVSNILQNFSSNFNVGFNHRPGDPYNTQQTQLFLSTQFFDNRLLIDGHFGYGGLSTNLSDVEQQSWAGEVNAEWKITNRFSFRAFTRPSERDLGRSPQTGYLQGIGIAYKREFDSFRPLFSRRREN